MSAARPEQAAVFYVDGHVRAYQGTRRIAKTHVPRLKFPAPATVETWVADAAGDPLLVVMAEPAASLVSELRRLIPELRDMVGDDRRVLVGFDRGGWSPTLFADLDAAGFDTLTWRKGATADIDEHLFVEHTHTDEHGRTHTWRLADTEVTLDIAEGPRAGDMFSMRQISLHDPARTRQMHILTTRRDLPAAEIRYRMGSRWRQENHYRYARIHFDLDSHDSYRTGDDDPTRMVPNPAKKTAYAQVEKARRALQSAQHAADAALLAAHSPKPGTTVVLTNAMINTINTDVHAAQLALDAAQAAHQAIPARLPLDQVNPGQQVLDSETKLIHHAIRIAAFNTMQSLARAIATATGYTRADDEAHTLIRTTLTGSGDIIPDPATDTLHIRLDPLPAPRHTAAIAELCQALNDTSTVYPGTGLTLRYNIKSHRRPHTKFLSYVRSPDVIECCQHAFAGLVRDGAVLGPTGGDIGDRQRERMSPTPDTAVVPHQVDLDEPRPGVVPFGPGAHRDLAFQQRSRFSANTAPEAIFGSLTGQAAIDGGR